MAILNEFLNDLMDIVAEDGNKVEIKDIEKNNSTKKALVVTPEGSRVGVTVYEDMIENLSDDEALALINRAIDSIPADMAASVEGITDYANVKSRLYVSVVSADNEAYLADKVYKVVEDLAIIVRIEAGKVEDALGSIVVTKAIFDQWNITEDQLIADALENSRTIRPGTLTGMSAMMAEMMGPEQAEMMGIEPVSFEDEGMIVVSNKERVNGASVIAYPNFLKEAAERIGGNFYILPSSIHEVLFVPDRGMMDAYTLRGMVLDVNATQVAPEEKLSDSVYYYDAEKEEFKRVA